jgi:hypothetical protein
MMLANVAVLYVPGLTNRLSIEIAFAARNNALYFTKPRNLIEDHAPDARAQNLLDAGYTAPAFKAQTTSNLAQASGSSITEHTTHHLKTER